MSSWIVKILTVVGIFLLTAAIGMIALEIVWSALQTMFDIPDLSWINAFVLCFASRFVVGSISGRIEFKEKE